MHQVAIQWSIFPHHKLCRSLPQNWSTSRSRRKCTNRNNNWWRPGNTLRVLVGSYWCRRNNNLPRSSYHYYRGWSKLRHGTAEERRESPPKRRGGPMARASSASPRVLESPTIRSPYGVVDTASLRCEWSSTCFLRRRTSSTSRRRLCRTAARIWPPAAAPPGRIRG